MIKNNFKPILFSTPMVRAIMEGRKTQTRRIIKRELPDDAHGFHFLPKKDWTIKRKIDNTWAYFVDPKTGSWPCNDEDKLKCRYKINDILWVRETWQHTKCLNLHITDENYGYIYKADGLPWEDFEEWSWEPSIFMPKKACRLFLELKDIRIEKLNDISPDDAIAEGMETVGLFLNYNGTNIEKFKKLWDLINGENSWNKNPFVWVYEFERTEASFV